MMGGIGANVNGIIIIMFFKLSLNLSLTDLLEIYWSPNGDFLPLLSIPGFPLAVSCGSDLVTMNLRYCVRLRVIWCNMFLRFLF